MTDEGLAELLSCSRDVGGARLADAVGRSWHDREDLGRTALAADGAGRLLAAAATSLLPRGDPALEPLAGARGRLATALGATGAVLLASARCALADELRRAAAVNVAWVAAGAMWPRAGHTRTSRRLVLATVALDAVMAAAQLTLAAQRKVRAVSSQAEGRRPGWWRRLVGPAGSVATAGILGGALVAAGAVAGTTPGPAWRKAVMAGLAFDIVGGLVAFQTRATRAEYARKSQAKHLRFVAVHVHPAVLAAMGEGAWRRAAARYAVAVTTTAVLERWGPSGAARRGVATAVGALAAFVDLATDRSDARWFGPAYHLKLVAGHAGIAAANRPGGPS